MNLNESVPGGFIPWHESEADRQAEISARTNQAAYPKIFQMPLIGGAHDAINGMMQSFAIMEAEISAEVVSMN